MALKLLLVDPDVEWLSTLKKFFSEKGYEVDIADSGKKAQLAIYNASTEKKDYFYIVLNLNIQNHSGPQVMKFIKSKHPGQNVCILIDKEDMEGEDGEEKMIDEEKLRRLGATDFLAKPFEDDDLLAKLEGHQSLSELIANMPKKDGQSDEVEIEGNEDGFSSIGINDFYPNKTVVFDIYVKINESKYLKILHAGDTL